MDPVALIDSTTFLKAAVIDLDMSFVVQLSMFLVLYFLLSTFFFKPYTRFLKRRDESTAGMREKATEMLRQAAELEDSTARRLEEARQAGIEERRRLAAEGARIRNQLIARERERIGNKVDAAVASINTEKESFLKNSDAAVTEVASLIEGQMMAAEGGSR